MYQARLRWGALKNYQRLRTSDVATALDWADEHYLLIASLPPTLEPFGQDYFDC